MMSRRRRQRHRKHGAGHGNRPVGRAIDAIAPAGHAPHLGTVVVRDKSDVLGRGLGNPRPSRRLQLFGHLPCSRIGDRLATSHGPPRRRVMLHFLAARIEAQRQRSAAMNGALPGSWRMNEATYPASVIAFSSFSPTRRAWTVFTAHHRAAREQLDRTDQQAPRTSHDREGR